MDSPRVTGNEGGTRPQNNHLVARILLALPYIGVVMMYASVSRLLALPGAVMALAVLLIYERLHPKSLWRYPAGWLVSLALIVPCAYLYVYEKIALVPLIAAPGVLLVAANVATSGAVLKWWARQPGFGSLVYLLVTTALLFGLTGRFGLPPLCDDLLFELYAAPEGYRLNQKEMDQSVDLVDACIHDYSRDDGNGIPTSVEAMEGGLETALRQNPEREVFVSLWMDRKAMIRGSSSGGRLYEDVCRATDGALDSTKRWRDWKDGADRVRIQVDILNEPVPLRRRTVHHVILAISEQCTRWFAPKLYEKRMKKDDRPFRHRVYAHQLFYEVEPGVDGLMLAAGDQQGRFLPGDAVTRGFLTPRIPRRADKIEKLMRQLCREARGAKDLWTQPGTKLFKFRSFCFGRPVPEGRVVEFYRGNVLVDEVDSHAILAGIEEAGGWLLRTVKPDGSFDYEYYPNTDAGSKGYNIVRHAGCVYGLFHMYNLALTEPQLRDEANDYLEAGVRAMDWVYDNLGPPKSAAAQGLVALNDERNRASSGAAALSLLSLLERPTPDQVSHPVLAEHLTRPEDDEILEGLGLFLLAMIDSEGRVFNRYKHRFKPCKQDPDGEFEYPRDFCEGEKEPLYYPGEVMLALVRLHIRTGEDRWLEGATRIADWQVAQYWDRRPNPDHWVMQALWYLYDLTGDESYGRCALNMGDKHASEQFPPHWPPFRDYFGSYRRINDLPRTTRACSRSEAMGGVVHTAWKMDEDPTTYEEALLRAAKHLLEHQWRPENSWFLPNPAKARGAIRMGMVDNHCRIDNNQHAVVGLHRALEVARKREGTPLASDVVLPEAPTAEEIVASKIRFGDIAEETLEPAEAEVQQP
jgi:hypothetical protein